MPPTVFTDRSGPTPGTELSAANMNSLATAGTSEASTMDALDASSTWINHLNRLRNQLGVVIGGAGSAWNAAVQMIPLSQKNAASGVAGVDASSNVTGPDTGFIRVKGLKANTATNPTIAPSTSAGTGATAALTSGNDMAGIITVTTGTGTSGQNVLATVTFGTALAAAPRLVLLTPFQNSGDGTNSGLLGLFAYNYQATGFYVLTPGTPAASSTYRFGFLVIQ